MSNCELGIIGVKKATADQLGVVKPDNTTTFVDENGVMSAVGGSGPGGDGISYSLEEQWTGKYWIDGKKIYQRTVDLGTIPPQSITADIPHNIENIENIVDYSGIAQGWLSNQNNWVSLHLPFANPSSPHSVMVSVSRANIKWNVGVNSFQGFRGMLTIQYTCTDR